MIDVIKETERQLAKGPKFLDRAKIENTLDEIAKCFPEVDYIDEITLVMLMAKTENAHFNVCSRNLYLPNGWDHTGVVTNPNFYFWAE